MKWVLGVAMSLALLALIATGIAGRRFVLVAKNDVMVDSYPVPGSVPIAKMLVGERATVLSCDDLKAYPAIHIRLGNGIEGYVVQGGYELKGSAIWDRSSSSPIVFGCSIY